MYKTVRHGENSLQYTILPQTEEVLNNSGVRGKGRDYSPSIHVRRSRSRSTLKYILLVLFGIVIVLALASVPLYVMNGGLYHRNQDSRDIITISPLTPMGREIVKSRKKELKVLPVTTTLPTTLETSSTITSTVSTSTTTMSAPASSERAVRPPWVPSRWKSTLPPTTIPPLPTENDEEIPLVGTPSGSIRLLDHYMSRKPWEDIIIKATVTPEPITIRAVFRYYSKSPEKATVNPKFEDVLITTKPTTIRPKITTEFTTTSEKSKLTDLKDTLLSVDDDDEFKESLEVDEVFSLPPLKPNTGDGDSEVTVSKAGGNGWYGARWPFVDTSSYFQWTGYSSGDNLLLPLLVAAVTSVALVLLLALAVRRRKRTRTACAQIGKLTADLQADDNTNLLTAENADDGEE